MYPSLCHHCSAIPSGMGCGESLRLSVGQVNLGVLAWVSPECRVWRDVALLPSGSWQRNSGVREVGQGGHTQNLPFSCCPQKAPEMEEADHVLTRQELNISRDWDPTRRMLSIA